MISHKNLKKLLPALPLLAIAAIPFSDMEIWRRVIVLLLLAGSYYVMAHVEDLK